MNIFNMTSKTLLYIALVVGVAGMGASIAYGTANQANYIQEGAELAPAAEQGSFSSPSGLGADLNKEQWHEDPFGDIAQKVKDNAGK